MNSIDPRLKSHFLNLYSIALSDTQIDTRELEFLFQFGEDRGISKEEIEEILLYPDKIKFEIPSETLRKIEYLYDFATMIWADDKVDEYEKIALEKFCLKFGFEKENIPALVDFLLEEAQKNTSKKELFQIVEQNL